VVGNIRLIIRRESVINKNGGAIAFLTESISINKLALRH
jgi:hypothetical protein